MNANAKIMELKLFLNDSRNRYSQITCLQILQHAEVDDTYKSLEGKEQVVLTKQCESSNPKLMVLKSMINNGASDPTKSELLQERYNARGDGLAVWNEDTRLVKVLHENSLEVPCRTTAPDNNG